eukprot:TRINITY_DN2244_c0_g2_i2.p2 TRINITY_DN2244_c0_g2~~TRINITY_DN2244_c0_g2_i2.p2  ORF type:complete len:234 (+),score=37.20 TRINITY_DN2244_c0_g2_i2:942-1643(+)
MLDEGGFQNVTHLKTIPIQAAKIDQSGLIFGLITVVVNCLGSLLSEKIMKHSSSTPFPTQKAMMEVTGCPVAILMTFIVPLYINVVPDKPLWWTDEGAVFFGGYSRWTFLAISIDMLLAWMGGLIVKQFSSVVKIIAKCFVVVLTIFLEGTFLKKCHAPPLPLPMFALAFIIATTTILFATMPKVQAAASAAMGPAGAFSSGQARQALMSDDAVAKRARNEVEMRDATAVVNP